MKLRRIDSQHYYDEESDTHFDLPALRLDNAEQAEAMIQKDLEEFLRRNPSGKYFGTRRLVLEIGHVDPPPPLEP